ncbi:MULTISPECIES: SDR family oxidoreductase [unclassified Streptomyces]|uniref:SDR family oxidoreductase n=1 Tax=unclassified Streptomyces TaxID=2593676 RepID=UPI0019457EB6|nr:SDR family NAD(P)-dependent oxidoreductase [Streptomyces sp. SID10853]WSU46258.1 SDR family NAD(P)-dependent oxidoreductase [Streptomyces sp. NBC_01089]
MWNESVAFITGGGQGIGLGIARALAKRGVRLALADIDEEMLHRAGEELSRVTEVETVRLDVRDRTAFAAAADAVAAKLGPVDLLFNNAGIAPHAPVAKWTFEKWDVALGINLDGVVNGLQTFVPRMIERGEGGHVVNTASGAGLIPNSSVLYTTAKFAVVGLSESLRRELSAYDIDVSVLCPGPVNTGILHNTGSVDEGVSVLRRGAAPSSTEGYLKEGTGIDAVGEMVIAGMEAKAMWIHTDDFVRPALKARMEAILESFPT